MMTDEELSYLSSWAKKYPVEKMKISRHLQKKDSVVINPWDIKRVLENENLKDYIIEFNKRFNGDGEFTQRVLIRDKEEHIIQFENRYGEKFQGAGNLCFVVDLTTWTLITAYWNKASDNHNSIDLSYYNPNLQISKEKSP